MAVTNSQILKEIKLIQSQLIVLQDNGAKAQQAESARAERESVQRILIQSHEVAIKGNGKAGLQTDVQLLKDGMGRINWVGAIFTAAVIADIASRLLIK